MKGTHCGKRAVTLVFLLIPLSAMAPAVASAADVAGVSAGVPAIPAVPAAANSAVPAVSVSVPATPSVQSAPVPAAATPSVPSAPVASPAKPRTHVAPVHVKAPLKEALSVSSGAKFKLVEAPAASVAGPLKPALSVATGAKVKLVQAPAAKSTKTITKPIRAIPPPVQIVAPNATVRVYNAPAYGTKPVKKATSVVFKKARKLMWADDGDWNKGCVTNQWQTCTQITPYGPVDNRCTDPTVGRSDSGTILPPQTPPEPAPVGPETVMFPTATDTVWTKSEPFTKNVGGIMVAGLKVTIKEFIHAKNGTGTPSGAAYRSLKDETTIRQVFIPIIAPFTQDLRQFVELLVAGGNWKAGYTPPPSMFYSEHQVIKFDGVGTSIKWTWKIVCSKGQKASDDQDEGSDHDRSGDYDKYRHNRHDYRGYNEDDSHETYDQND